MPVGRLTFAGLAATPVELDRAVGRRQGRAGAERSFAHAEVERAPEVAAGGGQGELERQSFATVPTVGNVRCVDSIETASLDQRQRRLLLPGGISN